MILDDIEHPEAGACFMSYVCAESDFYNITKKHFERLQTTANGTKYLLLYNKGLIARISVNIVAHCDIYGRSQARLLRYPDSGQYSLISVQ